MIVRYVIAAALVAFYLAWCFSLWRAYRRRQPSLQRNKWLIAYASQSGNAQRWAEKTAQQLHKAGIQAQIAALNDVQIEHLQHCEKLLLIVSSYGQGEAPDNGTRFIKRISNADLSAVNFAVLAFGDSEYPCFCGFADAVQQQLEQSAANALFETIKVDKNAATSLQEWQQALSYITDNAAFTPWQVPIFQPWRLLQRRCLNPQSPSEKVFYLRLQAVQNNSGQASWQAGDIAEIAPCNSRQRMDAFLALQAIKADADYYQQLKHKNLLLAQPISAIKSHRRDWLANLNDLPSREYSIASIADSGSLDLLVRQRDYGDDNYGLGSGCLSHVVQEGETIALSIRKNSNFHAPNGNIPLILIGNGTGLAGLRAHLQQRIQQGYYQNWLIYGERHQQHESFFAEELENWLKKQQLVHLHRSFSRDTDSNYRYVQDILYAQANEIRQWLEQGAAIYVCGSLHGMAEDVEHAFVRIIGEPSLLALSEQGRYRRDVY